MSCIQLPVLCPGVESQIAVTKGTDKTITLTFTDANGNPVDLTGATVTMEVKRNSVAVDILLTKVGVIIQPSTDGVVEFRFVAADYSAIQAGFYHFSITASSGLLGTIELLTGDFVINPFDQSLVGRIEPILSLGIVGSTERIALEIRDSQGVLANPTDLNLQIIDPADSLIVNLDFPVGSISNPEAGIFYYDFTSNRAGDFLAIWSTRFTGEEPIKTIKNLRFVTPTMFRMIAEVRLFIDKSRKASDRVIAFNPQDVAEYIEMSLRDFNAQPPTTALALENITNEFKAIIVEGAIVFSLIAQGLLAVDQDFQYNDNGIMLAIDHHGKLHQWYNTLMQGYVKRKETYKPNFFIPTVYSRTVVGQAFSLGLAKVPASTLSRFRGWI